MITAPMQPWLITLEAYRALCTVNFQSPAQSITIEEKAQETNLVELQEGDVVYKVNGVEVLNRAATVAAPANKAVYTVTAVADSSAGAQTYNEITRFAYNNGKYTATWNMNGGTGVTAGWTVTKN